MEHSPRAWACVGHGESPCPDRVLGIVYTRGRAPDRCPSCRRIHRAAGKRRERQVLAESLLAPVDPEPSKVPEPPTESEPYRSAMPTIGNQWSRRGKVALDLDGCPDPGVDLPAARCWVMETVFRVPLYTWQRETLAEIGSFPRHRRAYVQIGRKNGKSMLAAALVLTEMVLVGESAIYAISDSERNLNSVLMRELRTLIGRSREADAAFVVTAGGIEYPGNGSFLEMRHGKFSATQGINPTMVIMDEVHLQKSDEIWSGMLMAGAACRHFLMLGVTTPGYDLASFAHDLYQLARSESDPGLYSRIYEPANLECALDDREGWAQSNPRVADDPDFLDAMESDMRALPEHEFRRFRLGVWTATESAWLPYGAWDARATTGRVLTPGNIPTDRDVYLGFDGSFSGDSTALIAACGTHVSVAGCWENPGHKGWRVPRHEVEATIATWMEASRRVKVLADPPYWTREISEWQVRWPGRVLEFPTHVRARMAPACTAFYTAVMDGTLTHDGDRRLARHVANAIVKSSPQGDYITKPRATSPAKIDLAVASVVAFAASSAAAPRRPRVFVA